MINTIKKGETMSNEPEYKSISEVAEEMGIVRSSVYHYIKTLGIETKKFKLSREKYIAAADINRIKEVRKKPWLAGEKKKSEEAA
jgi:predicted DNA-binding protein YlxM (UPF0122 family)